MLKTLKNKFPNKSYSIAKSQQGSVLIEALISVLIFSMGILALVGLQAAMLKNTSDSKFRADASFIAQQELGRMWADPDNLGNFACNDVSAGACGDVSGVIPNGTRTVAVDANRIVTVTVGWQAPGMDAHNYRASTHISVSN